MGASQSSPAKDETRRARLSKPLTKKLAFSSPELTCSEANVPELTSGLIGWQNPWVGSQISTEVRRSGPRTRDIPPTEQRATQTSVQPPHDLEFKPVSLRSGTVSASPSVRRVSYQPGTLLRTYSQTSLKEQPKRAHSIQTAPSHRHSSVVYGDIFDNATTTNTAFLVDNQRFSLTRRRSLLTIPGVATRRTMSAVRRVPSPIGEPEVSHDDLMEPQGLQWPLLAARQPSRPMPPPARPSSPADTRYTQLGALKLGSLRVVNGAASPCPSERIPLDRTRSGGAGLGLDNVEGLVPGHSTVKIPSVSDLKKADDTPDSPFSYEKSPVMTTPSRGKSMFTGDSEDEGIAICDEGFVQLEQGGMNTGIERKPSSLLNKSDSGYSSATSDRSFQWGRGRTRTSFDSQGSGSYGANSAKNSWASRDPSRTRRGDQIQPPASLQRTNSVNFSQRNPSLSRWHERNGPSAIALAEPRARPSTMCESEYTEYLPNHTESIPMTVPRASIGGRSLSTRGQLYGDRFSMVDMTPLPPSSATLEKGSSYHQPMTNTKSLMQRSASEHRTRRGQEMLESHLRLRNRQRRAWSYRSGIEVPPLPTIVSPEPSQCEEKEMEFPVFDCRGRPRSRSQDHRRKLTKSRPHSTLFI